MGVPRFRLDSAFSPAADQPHAISEISAAIERGERMMTLLGATGATPLSVSAIESVVGSTGTDLVTMMSTGTLSVSAIETVTGSTFATDVVQYLAAGVTVALNGVESVIGTTGGADAARMIGTTLSVSAIESVLGTSGTSDKVTMLAAGSLTVSGVESVVGSGGTDVVTMLAAPSGTNSINVSLVETVVGTAGVDAFVFSGTVGVKVTGGGGIDTYTAGGGADSFVFTQVSDSPTGSADQITGFVSGTDKLDLSAITAGSGSLVASMALLNSVNGGDGLPHGFFDTTTKILHLDVGTPDGLADMQIKLNGLASLSNGDIIW